MNELLRDESWWNALRRADAEARFDRVIVEAFFGELQAGRENPRDIRDRLIELPGVAQGYARVLFVGTTGAGKTSLLRQLIGSDPDEDRFPSTAPAKTTIADIEVIQAPGDYSAAVTFFSEFQILAQIEECILDAALAAYHEDAPDRVAERFLNHRDQRFRLSYLLGAWQLETPSEDDAINFDDLTFDDDATASGASAVALPPSELPEREQTENRRRLASFIDRITQLARESTAEVAEKLGGIQAHSPTEDQEALEQLIEETFEQELIGREEFHELAQDVLETIRSKFEVVTKGELATKRSGWPQHWTFASKDRSEFIREIRWFSSNYWPEFGRLLTPLVEGIRVRGPLYPDYAQPKLVLIDGQGLGHTPDPTASVTTHITRRFSDVDLILLVDNAKQPMQSSSMSVLRAVGASGNADKLAIAFTHFDQITGVNLRSLADRRTHVMRSVNSALATLRTVLGPSIVRPLEARLEERCFLLGGVDKSLERMNPGASRYMTAQLRSLSDVAQRSGVHENVPEARPHYETMLLSLAVKQGLEAFHHAWTARLGLGFAEGVRREHWTRVKALSRRISSEADVEYDTLKPLADLVSNLTLNLSWFVERPARWSVGSEDESSQRKAVTLIQRSVSAHLHELAHHRVILDQLREWRSAYNYVGPGSARNRANLIHLILDEAAPVPGTTAGNSSRSFLQAVRSILTAAVDEIGGLVVDS